MASLQEQYDQAMFDFSQGAVENAIAQLHAILDADPAHFDAQLSLGMAFSRQGDFPRAIAEGHKAEKLRPHDPLVHTNLSIFYMKSGDKKTAEHHGLKARIASWKDNMDPPTPSAGADELSIAKGEPPSFPDMPWKRNKETKENKKP